MLVKLRLHVVDLFELVQEPGIDRRYLCQLLDGASLAERVTNIAEALGMRCDKALRQKSWFDFF